MPNDIDHVGDFFSHSTKKVKRKDCDVDFMSRELPHIEGDITGDFSYMDKLLMAMSFNSQACQDTWSWGWGGSYEQKSEVEGWWLEGIFSLASCWYP